MTDFTSPVGYKPKEDLYHWPRFRSGKSSDYKRWRTERKKEAKFLMSEFPMGDCRGFRINAGEVGCGISNFNMKNWRLSGFIWEKNPTNSYLCLLLTWSPPAAMSRGHCFLFWSQWARAQTHTRRKRWWRKKPVPHQVKAVNSQPQHTPSQNHVSSDLQKPAWNKIWVPEGLLHSPRTTGLPGVALPNPAYCWQKSLEGPPCEKQVLHRVCLPAGRKSNLSQQEFIQGSSLTCLWGNKDLRSFCSNTNVSKSFLMQESRRFYFCLTALDSS